MKTERNHRIMVAFCEDELNLQMLSIRFGLSANSCKAAMIRHLETISDVTIRDNEEIRAFYPEYIQQYNQRKNG